MRKKTDIFKYRMKSEKKKVQKDKQLTHSRQGFIFFSV